MACTEVMEPLLVEVMRSWRRAHLGGQRGLVTHGAGDAAEERGHLRAGLGEAEDVVDEEEHVAALHVAEVLGDGERRERHAGAGAGRLVHLAVHEHAPGCFSSLSRLMTLALLELVVEVVALAGALAHAGEHARSRPSPWPRCG